MRSTYRHPRAIVLTTLGLGIAADLLFYDRIPGISVPLFIGLCIAGLFLFGRLEQRFPTPGNRWLGLAALLFATLTAVRAEPTLVFLNATACITLILLQVGLFRGPLLSGLTGAQYVWRSIVAMVHIGIQPPPAILRVLAALIPRGERSRLLAPIGRGLLLALPIIVVFTLLLMAADTIFAKYVAQAFAFSSWFNGAELIAHTILIGIVIWMCSGALLTALRDQSEQMPAEGATQILPRAPWQLGCVEALTVLILVDALFAGFMVIQAAYLFGGLYTLTQSGMTYADYARRGFFELIAVAFLSIGLLWLLINRTRRDLAWHGPAFNSSGALLIFLTLGLLGSAFQRMWLYEQAYGFTHLRIYTHVFMLWLVVLLGLLLATLFSGKLRWFPFGGFVSALVVLALLTLADPETIIVRANVARYQATGNPDLIGAGADPVEEGYGSYRPSREIDSGYLARLSPDATPALIEALPLLPPAEQAAIRAGLDDQRDWLVKEAAHSGWPGWHFARWRALAVLEHE
jgi:hypothetical protein